MCNHNFICSKIYYLLIVIYNFNLIYGQFDECLNKNNTFQKCANGDCLPIEDYYCYGINDCDNKSDETVKICSSINCCGYGACINRNLKCNQTENCADGSDKALTLCHKTGKNIIKSNLTRKSLPVLISPTLAPSHVGIYSNRRTSSYEYICGGTIINSKIIISAAHCFFDERNQSHFLNKYFTIAAGKHYRSFTKHEKYAQFSNISIIRKSVDFIGSKNNFLNDICIVILNDNLHFNSYIQPACIQWKQDTEQVQTNIEGKINSFGVTTTFGDLSETIELKTLSYADCVEEIKQQENGILPTIDQFCATSSNGGVCVGASGSGFFVEERVGIRKPYCLWGVLSHGNSFSNNFCPNITIFTDIQIFKNEILKYLEIYNSIYENCFDGSNEDGFLCNTVDENSISTTTPMGPFDILTPKPQQPGSGCLIENIPYLTFTFNDEIFSPGDYVESSVKVSYKCEPEYFVEGELENFCLNNKWRKSHPTCLKFCPSDVLQGVTFKADCKFQNLDIPCDQSLRPGAQAIISCQVGYEKPPDTTTFPEVLTCDKSGNWDYSPPRCFQSCGEEPIKLTPFIGGGKTVQITSVPWQVAIYSNLESRTYQFICGGTIINPKIIISAAHCFYDDVSRKLYDRKYYTIAAGKSYRSFTQEKYSQFSNISEIHIPRLYVGLVGSFLNDLAIVILNNDLRFSNYIKPACIQWKTYAEQVVQTGIAGRVAGWGITTSGNVSDTLQVLEVETLSHADCTKETKNGEPPTNDKFCIRNPFGAVCQGDSGGGFLVPEKLGNKNRYYLWGIVSHLTANQLLACSDNLITSFTNIQFFKEQIETYLEMHNPK